MLPVNIICRLIALSLTAALAGCATADFTPYVGAQQNWPTAGLTRWPNNGLRYSFASYRLAFTHDAPRVASELEHTSSQMLYSTYRELVLSEEAAKYCIAFRGN
jgi:hypothetical protein